MRAIHMSPRFGLGAVTQLIRKRFGHTIQEVLRHRADTSGGDLISDNAGVSRCVGIGLPSHWIGGLVKGIPSPVKSPPLGQKERGPGSSRLDHGLADLGRAESI
jgi:hypothetical protein